MENLLTAKQYEELTKKLEANELYQKSKSIHKVLQFLYARKTAICLKGTKALMKKKLNLSFIILRMDFYIQKMPSLPFSIRDTGKSGNMAF